MTKQEIQKGNESIAEFMGYQILKKNYQCKSYNSSDEYYWEWDEGEIVCDSAGNEVDDINGEPFYSLEDLPFNTSWDWLMSVVEKIGILNVSKTISMGQPQPDFEGMYHCHIMERDHYMAERFESVSWKEATWLAVVEFITWYTENK